MAKKRLGKIELNLKKRRESVGVLKAAAVARLRECDLSERVVNAIHEVVVLHQDSTDWLVVKKSLLRTLPVYDRQLFSRRDEVSKKHQPFNSFEKRVRSLWQSLTGNLLLMPPDKQMDGVDPELYL